MFHLSLCPLLILFVLLRPLSGSCQCTGQSNDQIYSGGDGSPLTWRSLRNTQDHAGQVVSYERTVENHSDQDVIDIFWPVAGYSKDLLPSKQSICDQTTLIGDSVTDNGILNFGTSNVPNYKTASYHPRKGWSSVKIAGLETGKFIGLETDKQPSLSSDLEVAVRGAKGAAICDVHLISAVAVGQGEQGRTKYNYSMENRGPENLRVFWDIPITDEFAKQLRMTRDNPAFLRPREPITINFEAPQKPVATATTFFMFDSTGKLVSRSIIGVWGQYQGQTTTQISKEWTQTEK